MTRPDETVELVYTDCGHCGKKGAPMKIKNEHFEVTDYFNGEEYQGSQEEYNYMLLRCLACDNLNYVVEEIDGGERHLLWPRPPKELLGLPSKIAAEYKTTLKVRTVDSNLFAVGLGRVITLVCIDQNAKGKDFYEKIKNLAERNILPQTIAEMAHQLRFFRNVGAHAEMGELSPSEVPIIEGLCDAILEYVYHGPKLIEQINKRIERFKSSQQKKFDSC